MPEIDSQNNLQISNPGAGFGKKTAAGGTPFWRIIPGKPKLRTVITSLNYLNAVDAHVVTLMFPVHPIGGKCFVPLASEAAAGQKVMVLPSNPTMPDGTPLAASDFVAWVDENGNTQADLVASVSNLNYTLTSNLPSKVLKGSSVFILGAPGTEHTDRQLDLLAAASLKEQKFGPGVLAMSQGNNQPMLIYSNNATTAGTINHVGVEYQRVTG